MAGAKPKRLHSNGHTKGNKGPKNKSLRPFAIKKRGDA